MTIAGAFSGGGSCIGLLKLCVESRNIIVWSYGKSEQLPLWLNQITVATVQSESSCTFPESIDVPTFYCNKHCRLGVLYLE